MVSPKAPSGWDPRSNWTLFGDTKKVFVIVGGGPARTELTTRMVRVALPRPRATSVSVPEDEVTMDRMVESEDRRMRCGLEYGDPSTVTETAAAVRTPAVSVVSPVYVSTTCPDRGPVAASQVARIATATRDPATAAIRGAPRTTAFQPAARWGGRERSPVLAANSGVARRRPPFDEVPEAVSERIFHLRQGRPRVGQRFRAGPRIGGIGDCSFL